MFITFNDNYIDMGMSSVVQTSIHLYHNPTLCILCLALWYFFIFAVLCNISFQNLNRPEMLSPYIQFSGTKWAAPKSCLDEGRLYSRADLDLSDWNTPHQNRFVSLRTEWKCIVFIQHRTTRGLCTGEISWQLRGFNKHFCLVMSSDRFCKFHIAFNFST